MDFKFVVPMAFAAASKAFRASTVCADVDLAPTVMSATKRTASDQRFRFICLSSLGVKNRFARKLGPLARLYGAPGLFFNRIIIALTVNRGRNFAIKGKNLQAEKQSGQPGLSWTGRFGLESMSST